MKAANQPLDLTQLRVRPLADKTCLDRFGCGNSDIDRFARKAHKWTSRNRVKVFSAHDGEVRWGLGFYSLSVTVDDKRKIMAPDAQVYDSWVPLIYIDAIGVRQPYQGQGMGRMLLVDALKRAHFVSENVAVYGVALRSLNDRTTAFYEKHGFGKVDNEKHPLMVVPIWTLNDLFRE